MIVISYDISNDKLRTRFSKYLSRFGHRIQYSVFEIDNSESFLSTIEIDIKNNVEKYFSQEDSIYIFRLSKNCKVTKYGYAKNEDRDFFIIS